MGFFNKTLGSAFDDEAGDDNYVYDEEQSDYDEEQEAPRKNEKKGGLFGLFRKQEQTQDGFDDSQEDPSEAYEETSGGPRTMESSSRSGDTGSAPMRRIRFGQPVLFNTFPKTMEDCSIIGDRVKAGNIVVVNVEGIDPGLAQRISDFASGLCYGVDGNYRKLSDYVFVVCDDKVSLEGSYPGNA